ncbi:MAG: hypothetical protein K5739_00620 [Lachnospiraceae bacterium]|nr:hypothetical protein [Lachnospiraceae bacterium]
MPEREVAQFEHEIEIDTGIRIDEAWSRQLTNEEALRLPATYIDMDCLCTALPVNG